MEELNVITEADRYVFGKGCHYEIYRKLGAHIMEIDNKKGVYFAVWAPNAVSVSVVGDFNDWDDEKDEMKVLGKSGIWETFVPEAKKWDKYKFSIETKTGQILHKADPYAFHAELRPGNASKVAEIDGFKWSDAKWVEKQEKEDRYDRPMAIYEMHPGSWIKDYSRGEDGFLDYKTIADKLVPYLKEMGYTHVELIGVAEHPFDGSWGYQVTGYYAPTARYGGPEEFMYFVNTMHKNNIGVILDWVPAHFPKDAHGLAEFDGECLYEYHNPKKGEHADWGTKVFDYERNEVSNFLIANALFWAEVYHIDALRVDAVASMLYLDYGRSAGNWVPNKYGENKNLEAIEFLKHLNSIMSKRTKSCYLIAEESTAWPKVTGAVEDNGLGFGFKWNMGWMNDFLEYCKTDPLFRKGGHNKMTFSISYMTAENYILVISHDEVVHLKCSMVNKMPGYMVDKFANLRTAYTFMIGHPGKKLLFMGQEFAQLREWSEERELDWFLLNEPLHKEMQEYVKKLIHLYRKNPALYSNDRSYEGFQWVNVNDSERSIFSFIRKMPDTWKGAFLFICNFTPMERPDYSVGVPKEGVYKEVLSSYSGTIPEDTFESAEEKNTELTLRKFKTVEEECDDRPYRLNIPLRPYESIIIAF
ncbi:MAG: 1,4-alpha-glucan branching protein GlgB [Lachnospiraceae bacterium]|nr:1,4-alpha-glucan branching protein GlgB [Lachnospiraceae bacterium]